MKKKTSYILILLVIVVCIVLDLITKVIFQNYFADDKESIVVIKDFFEFTYIKNTGAAFGWFGNSTVGLTIVSVVFVVMFFVYDYFSHSNSVWYVLGLGFIIGGAIGNLIDRVWLGKVRDFIFVLYNTGIFPAIFNVADIALVVGVIMICVYLLFLDKDAVFKVKNKGAKTNENDNDTI